MALVNVPGVGQLQFPDGMSQQDMAAAIQKNFPQIHGPQAQQNAAPQQAPSLAASQGGALDAEAAMPAASDALVHGLGDVPNRIGAGIRQLGGDLSDMWNTYINPKIDPATGKGIMPHAAQDVTDAENARRAALTQANVQANQQAGQAPADAQANAQMSDQAAAAGTGAVQAAPAVLAGAAGPEGVMGTTGYLANAMRQTAAGAAQGALAFSPDNNKSGQIATGSMLGAGLSLFNPLSIYNAAMNRVAAAIKSAGGPSEAAYQSAKDVMQWGQGNPGDPTLAMRTGLPITRTLEGMSFNGTLQNAYSAARDAVVRRFRAVFDLPQTSVDSPSLDGAFAKAQAAAKATVDGLKAQRSQAYEAGMARAAELTTQPVQLAEAPREPMTFTQGGVPTPDLSHWAIPPRPAAVPAFNLQQQLGVLMQKDGNAVGVTGALDKPWASAVMNRLTSANGTPPGSLSVQDTAAILEKLTSMSQDTNPTVRAYGRTLRNAFNTDLDLIAQNAQEAHPAVQQLLATRAGYRAASQNIEALQQSAAYRFLGVGPKDSVDPATLVQRFSGLDASKQQQVASYLRQYQPDLLQLLRRKVVNDAANAAQATVSPAGVSDADPVALINHVFDGGKLRTSALWNADERVQMEKFRQAVNVVSNAPMAAGRNAVGQGTVVGPAEIAPNVISLNPIFIGRQLARAVQGTKGADIFTDPTALAGFTKLRSTSGPAQQAAQAWLGQYLASQAKGDSTNGSSQAPQ